MIEIHPVGANIIARLIDMQRTESGLIMPDSTQMKGFTVPALVEKVGPDVKNCKPGDLIIQRVSEHILLRGGTFHRVTIHDNQVVGTVTGLDPKTFKFLDERVTAGVDNGEKRLVT